VLLPSGRWAGADRIVIVIPELPGGKLDSLLAMWPVCSAADRGGAFVRFVDYIAPDDKHPDIIIEALQISISKLGDLQMKSRKVGRPRTNATPVLVRLHSECLSRVDAWIASRPEPMSRPEAIRQLLADSLGQRPAISSAVG
jgi:hypothetical protein